MFGKQFKVLRIQQGISLQQAAQNAMSYSSLSRWENDKSDIHLSQLIKILANIHISLKEFYNICNINLSQPIYFDIVNAYINKDLQSLKKLADLQIQKFYKNKKQYDLFLASTACSCYMDLTHINILPLYCQNRLFYIFSNVEYWTITFINTFGNSVFLLEDKKLYNIASRILLNISKYRKDEFEEFYYAMSSIINAFTQLIFINPNLALKLEKRLIKLIFLDLSNI